jgi:glucokinase
VDNDALCAAWGEWILHPEHPASLVYVGLGTGVGGGLVLEGRPYRGCRGFAMEVGHVVVQRDGRLCGCGNRGCLERYASATGVRASYVEAGGEALEAHEIAARAREGDERALAAFERAGVELATVIAHLVKTIDVPDVVVGGGMAASWDLMGPFFDRRLEHDLLPVMRGRTHVRLSTADDRAGMLGAARLGAASDAARHATRDDDRREGTE